MKGFILLAALLLMFPPPAAAQEGSSKVTVTQPWSRATPGGAKTGAAFFQVTGGAQGDKLLAAKSDAAERVELHNHIEEDGVMKMRRVDAVEIPAGGTVTFEPGGYHVMLINLKGPLKAGEELNLRLVFEKAGEIDVKAPIEPIGSKGPAGHNHSDHDSHGHDHDHDHDKQDDHQHGHKH